MLTEARRAVSRYARNHELLWRWLINGRSTLAYRRDPSQLTGEAARVLADLDRDGVAVTSVDALPQLRPAYDELRAAALALPTPERRGEKDFNAMLLGEDQLAFDPASIFVRIALAEPILDIANGYFEMHTRLRYFNVWRTRKSEGAAKQSQLWHRDHEDRLILKLFIYLEDVDADGGPFSYARGTHPKGNPPDVEWFDESGVRRTTDEQMARSVPRDRWFSAVGKAGTLIFADTRGYHKGGYVRVGSRFMYNCMWTSRMSQSRDWFTPPTTELGRFEALGARPRGRVDW